MERLTESPFLSWPLSAPINAPREAARPRFVDGLDLAWAAACCGVQGYANASIGSMRSAQWHLSQILAPRTPWAALAGCPGGLPLAPIETVHIVEHFVTSVVDGLVFGFVAACWQGVTDFIRGLCPNTWLSADALAARRAELRSWPGFLGRHLAAGERWTGSAVQRLLVRYAWSSARGAAAFTASALALPFLLPGYHRCAVGCLGRCRPPYARGGSSGGASFAPNPPSVLSSRVRARGEDARSSRRA